MPAAALLKEPFTPAIIVDGAVVDQPPADAYRQRRLNPTAAFMIGSNDDEGAIFLTGRQVTPENIDTVLGGDFPPWLVKLALPFPGKTPATAYDAAKRFEGDVRFHWDMWTWARLAAGAGTPVYLYTFDHPTPCTPDEGCVETTRHGDEMAYVFGHDLANTWSGQDRELSRLIVRCWTHFAKTGSPDGCGLPDWPSYDERATMMVLGNSPRATQMQPDFTLQRLDWVYRLAEVVVARPIIALATALLTLSAIIWILTMLIRWCVRRAPTHRTQSGSA